MRKFKNLFIFSLIIFALLSFYSFANAETAKGDEIISDEEIQVPSEGFTKEATNANTSSSSSSSRSSNLSECESANSDSNSDSSSSISASSTTNTNNAYMEMAGASNATTYTEGNYQYQIEEDFEIITATVTGHITSIITQDIATITKYTGNESTVTIPETLGGKRVYKIGNAAFYQNTSIKKLIIPDNTVGYIGEGAFADCTNLQEVSFGKGIDNISYYAFQHTALTSVSFPETLSAIRNTTFFECEKLTSITISSENELLKTIDNVIYDITPQGMLAMILYPYAKTDKSFTVPDKVISINSEAIMNNYLETLTLSASVNNIWLTSYALTTPNLKNIYVNNSNTTYASIDGVLFSKDKKIIYYYPAGRTATSYSIPSGTTTISKDTFFKATNLKNVNIPNTVTTLDTEAFGYMPALQEITIPSSVAEIGAQIFPECPSLKKATVNANAEVLSYLMFKRCENLEEVIINGNIKTIIQGAFYYCTSLTKVTLPESLEEIEFGAFWDCWALKNITIPENVVFLEDCAFYDHRKIQNDYWADTKFDISKTKLVKQNNGNYTVTYNFDVQGTRLYDYAYKVLELVNQERTKQGLNALTMDKSLLETAMKRSAEIVVLFDLDHERPNGSSWDSAITKTQYNRAAENIAEYQTTPQSVMTSWMDSSEHKANILNSSYTCIGIGCFKANDGKYYWVQTFTDGTPEKISQQKNTNTKQSVQILSNRIPFSDVESTDWFYYAVKYTVTNNMILGYNSSTFSPDSTITRGMVVTILHRMEGYPKATIKNKFSDVSSSQYYYDAIVWATEKGIVHGYENKKGEFGPDDNITREDLVVILKNYTIYKGKNVSISTDLSKFNDSSKVSEHAITSMQWAVAKGVITGTNNGKSLSPQGIATRAEFAAMLHKYKINIK